MYQRLEPRDLHLPSEWPAYDGCCVLSKLEKYFEMVCWLVIKYSRHFKSVSGVNYGRRRAYGKLFLLLIIAVMINMQVMLYFLVVDRKSSFPSTFLLTNSKGGAQGDCSPGCSFPCGNLGLCLWRNFSFCCFLLYVLMIPLDVFLFKLCGPHCPASSCLTGVTGLWNRKPVNYQLCPTQE